MNTAIAQMTDKEKMLETFYLVDESRFPEAKVILEELQAKKPDDANIAYHLGMVYQASFSDNEKRKALPLLEKASEQVSSRYVYFNVKENQAPVETFYYLGLAQHNASKFTEAIASFTAFKELINSKHPLWKEIDQQIGMAKYAQEAIKNPVEIRMDNLGDGLNSYFPDFSPVVNIDESAIYFTSRRMRKDSSNHDELDPADGMFFEDIYVSYQEEDGWGEAQLLNINTDEHEAVINISIDGKTLYLYRDDNGNGELYKSEFLNTTDGAEVWSEPEKLGSDINSKAYETHVTVSPDGSVLYFVSDRDGGYGGKDIYFCKRLPNGEWSKSQNAGPTLNSKFDEDGVFIHPDGKTLYFASNGHKSMGGYDINYSIHTDTGWTEPENMGYPINSVEDDVFFVVTPDGKRAYFSSFKEEGIGEKDIYRLRLIDAVEIPLALFKGRFTFADENYPPSEAQIIIFDNESGQMEGVYIPRERDGSFSVILQPGRSYTITYEADGFEPYEEVLTVKDSTSYSEIYKEIYLKPVRAFDQQITADGGEEVGIELDTATGQALVVQYTLKDTITIDSNVFASKELKKQKKKKRKERYRLFDQNRKPLANTKIRLENAEGTLIDRLMTDGEGYFEYKKLPIDTEFNFILEDVEEDVTEVLITNEIIGELLLINRDGNGFRYKPEEHPHLAALYQSEIAADAPSEVQQNIKHKGLAMKAHTVGVGNGKGSERLYPKPKDLEEVVTYFQKYFRYNMKDVDPTTKEMQAFIGEIVELIQQRGFAKIILTSSASKVPTRQWGGSNAVLAKKRAYDCKALLENELKKKGVKEDQYQFIDINTLVSGPEYKGDGALNRTLYEQYQYVRVMIK